VRGGDLRAGSAMGTGLHRQTACGVTGAGERSPSRRSGAESEPSAP
jgi:hypothetical protein